VHRKVKECNNGVSTLSRSADLSYGDPGVFYLTSDVKKRDNRSA
jgi:hypothetical protein